MKRPTAAGTVNPSPNSRLRFCRKLASFLSPAASARESSGRRTTPIAMAITPNGNCTRRSAKFITAMAPLWADAIICPTSRLIWVIPPAMAVGTASTKSRFTGALSVGMRNESGKPSLTTPLINNPNCKRPDSATPQAIQTPMSRGVKLLAQQKTKIPISTTFSNTGARAARKYFLKAFKMPDNIATNDIAAR